MKQQTYLHIPTPCHEDWNKMTQSEKGKFCNACSKQVVDFTFMSDQEVLNYFSKTSGSTCGRFAADQLQRPIEPVKTERKKAWWIAALMPLLLFFDKSYGQRKSPKQTNTVCTNKDTAYPLMGKVATGIRPVVTDTVYNNVLIGAVIAAPIPNENILKGTVTDENNIPLITATIQVEGTNISTVTDTTGSYELNLSMLNKSSVTITASYVGYVTYEKTIDINSYLPDGDFMLEQKVIEPDSFTVNANTLGEVVTVGFTVCQVVKEPTIIDTAKSVIQQVFNSKPFIIFPNPAPLGSPVNIDVKKEGDYSIALFDNSGKLLLVKDFTAAGTTITSIDMPAMLAAGIYHIQVTNKKTKKQESGKIVVE